MNKKRKLLALVTCLLVTVSLILSGCGAATADKPAGLGSGSSFSSWFGPGKKLSKQEPGTYYFQLTKDIKIDAEGVIAGQNVVIDLNGHTITGGNHRAFAVSAGGSLVLKNGTVQTMGADANGGVISLEDAKGLELVDVNLANTDDTQISDRLSGGVLYANAKEACTIHISGNSTLTGSASGLRRSGGTVSIAGQTEMYLLGGTIRGGKAGTGGNILMDNKAALYLLGGTVEGGFAENTSEITGFGGNIYTQTMTRIYMYGGTVRGGQAENAGGNIFLSNTASVDGESGLYLYDGLITGGKALYEGGNIYASEKDSVVHMLGGTVEAGEATLGANIFLQGGVLDMLGGTLVGNATGDTQMGGNLYGSAAIMRLYDGIIKDGAAQTMGGNVCMYDSQIELYGGVICDGISYSTQVSQGGGNFYAGKASTVNMYGGEIYGGIANVTKDEESSSAGANVMIGGTTKMQLFGGTVKDGMVYGKITRGGGIYVYGQAAGNDSVLHMYGGTVENGPTENTMRGMCIGAYSSTGDDSGFATARIFDGEIIFTGEQNHPDRLHAIYGNKTNNRDMRIFDDTNYKGLYRRTTVGPCPDASHNTKTGEVAATCLTHGYTEYTCGTCGVWCVITAQPTGHTEQTESVTTEQGVTYTRHSCTACDLTWTTQVDATAAEKQN